MGSSRGHLELVDAARNCTAAAGTCSGCCAEEIDDVVAGNGV